MDLEKLSMAVEQKHRVRFDYHDPVFVLGTIAEEVTKEMMAAMGKIVSDAADQMATSNVLAETNARAKAETIVTEAAKWGAEQIRMAGADAASQILTELKAGLDEITVRRDEARMWSLWNIGAATVTVLAVMALVWKV
jgi:malonyl CoA-acyl carrier protein transacylase